MTCRSSIPGTPTRVYNYWLGGKDNFAADREAAEQAIAANPGIKTDVRATWFEPGVVQPQQWRPEPETLSPPQVTAWCGVARKR